MGDDRPAADDLDRRTRVRALIDGARRQTADATRPRSRPSLRAISGPDSLPGYELLHEIHRGGQGVVYQTRQRATGRTVAVKFMREGPFGGSRDRARFEREIHVLAQLDHPNIVGILDSGTAAGSAYFVMDYVAGVPFDHYVGKVEKSKKVETEERLRLFAKVCDAVHAAHLRGIIHRDLKPNNVLVDTAGEPHILDFGLAKLDNTEVDSAGGVTVTTAGHFVGSLPWASPEQAAGETDDIDIRTDVYSLGVMLYQTLSGRFPYSVAGNMRDVLDRIMTAEPAPLRQRAAGFTPALFRMRGADARRISAGVNPAALFIDDELETIVLKCLSKEPQRRYQSAGELARDIRHYLADEPIEAKRDSGWYVLRKALRRHRRGAAVAAAFAMLLAAGAVALSSLYVRQGRLLVEVERERDKAVSAERLADQRFRQAEYESYVANIAAADAAIAASDGGAALARLQTVPAELRNWEWHHLVRQADQSVATWSGPQGLITGRVRLSPDGRYVGASFWMEGKDGALRVWRRSASDAPGEAAFAREHFGPFEFLPDGRRLLFGDPEGPIAQFDLAEGRQTSRSQITPLRGAIGAEFSPDGRILFTQAGPTFRLWDAVAGELRHETTLPGRAWGGIGGFDATGSRVALQLGYGTLAERTSGTLSVWDVAAGREIGRTPAHSGGIYGMAFRGDGHMVATSGGEEGEIKLWEIGAQGATTHSADQGPAIRLVRELHDGGQRVGIPSFSPNGTLLAAPSADKAVRIWNVADGELRTTLLGHTAPATCTDFGSDGRFLVSGDRGGVIKLWDLQQAPPVHAFRELPGPVNSIAFTPDGARLLLECSAVYLIDRASGRRLHESSPPPPAGGGETLSGPDGLQATFSDVGGRIRVWDIGSPAEGRFIGTHKSIPRLAGDPSRRVLASADADAVVLWDWAEGRELSRFAGPGEPVRCVAISSDTAILVLGLTTGELIVQDAQTGEGFPVERAHSSAINSIAFSADGRSWATGSEDGAVKLWDVAGGHVVWSASPQMGDVWCVAFSPDGTRLAAGGRDRSVRLFDPQTGRELLALRGPTGTVMCVAFSPDGRSIAAGSWAREVFIWDAADPG